MGEEYDFDVVKYEDSEFCGIERSTYTSSDVRHLRFLCKCL